MGALPGPLRRELHLLELLTNLIGSAAAAADPEATEGAAAEALSR